MQHMIVEPKRGYAFQVSFKSVQNVLMNQCQILSLALRSLDEIYYLNDNECTFVFTDDINNEVEEALLTFITSTDPEIVINYLNPTNNSIIRSLKLNNISIVNLRYSSLEYASGAHKLVTIGLVIRYNSVEILPNV